ncbi:MAG: MFS transporter [Bacteroidota bacterium]
MRFKTGASVLPVIVISQACCVSLWFAGNAVMENLVLHFKLSEGALAYITSSVQLGFILGTLVFSIFMIADRLPPSKLFFIAALAGALLNGLIVVGHQNLVSLLLFRFLTGFCLAGIYPVGMKIAADHYDNRLGKALGFLVGALVLGTALPHLLKDILRDLNWKYTLVSTSVLALSGGLLMLIFVSNGPYRKPGSKTDFSAFRKIFGNKELSAASFGYFGHMWELYAFWAFVPFMLRHYQNSHPSANLNVSLLSFCIIGVGAFSCVAGGMLSYRFGTKRIAAASLLSSCICCIVSPVIFIFGNEWVLVAFLLFWGLTVIADSPLFSTLVAQNVQPEFKGTALTLITCIGFSITILSIQLMGYLAGRLNPGYIFTILSIGPILGIIAMTKSGKR